MAFRALLSSKASETNAAVVAACERREIRVEVCLDIFSAIEKGKTQPYSCVIVDWTDQPESSFLLRRARESANRDTVAIAIVDRDPTAAEIRDNRLDFLIRRPISAADADALLAKACAQMQPSADVESPIEGSLAGSEGKCATCDPDESEIGGEDDDSVAFLEADPAEAGGEPPAIERKKSAPESSHAAGFRIVLAGLLVLATAFCLWRFHGAIPHLPRTGFSALRESAAAFFHENPSEALPAGYARSAAQQDSTVSANSAGPDKQTPALGVVASETSIADAHIPLPKAPEFPLPAPVLVHQDPAPIHKERVTIPESMKSSSPIAPPVVVTVNPAQMMPVSTPQPAALPQLSEPVAMSEPQQRALLTHSVEPAYPAEALAQKLHGSVVLQAVIGRDGTVQDLKLVRGYFVLGQAAISAVKQWQFQPYMVNGRAVSTLTTLTISFTSPTP